LSIINGLLGLVSIAYPQAAPIVGIITKIEPYLETAVPAIKAAIAEGPSAFEAAKKAAPDLAKEIENLAHHVFGNKGELALEKVTHALVGQPMKPGSVEEKRWFDRASGGPSAGV